MVFHNFKPCERELSHLTNRARQKVSQLDEVTEGRLAAVTDEFSVTVPVLDRSAAKFVSETTGTASAVRVAIPFTGDAKVFEWSPDDRWYGDVGGHVHRGSVRGHDQILEGQDALVLERTFDPGTDPAAVKEWARTQFDKIQSVLDAIALQIGQHNRVLPAQVRQWGQERAGALETTTTLSDGLSDGF